MGLRGPGCRGPVVTTDLRRGGGVVGKPGGGDELRAAAVGGRDAAGRGRRGDKWWDRHRAGERGFELISVGGGGASGGAGGGGRRGRSGQEASAMAAPLVARVRNRRPLDGSCKLN